MREQFNLKPISKEAVPRAIQKAERYRLINQSWAAESICRDILGIDPANQQVLVMLVLALTDQLAEGGGVCVFRCAGIGAAAKGKASATRKKSLLQRSCINLPGQVRMPTPRAESAGYLN